MRARSRSTCSGSSATTRRSTRAPSGSTRALARILTAAGVDFGILYDGERNAGNDVRRVGEEGLFETLAEQQHRRHSSGCEFNRIVTTDPHSLNTLRNEYPDARRRVDRRSTTPTLLLELIEAGALEPQVKLGHRVTYHDPCHLGRYNGDYDAAAPHPRARSAASWSRCRATATTRSAAAPAAAGSGCPDSRPASERPSENRIREAVRPRPASIYFVVACPKDVTMYEDAIKTTGRDDDLTLAELSELVLESLGAPA